MTEDEKLDHDLKNRIIEVFDHYDDTQADAGWALLRQKYPTQNKKRMAAWPWYAAAAVLLLFLTIWVVQKPATDNYVSTKRINKKPAQKNDQYTSAVPHNKPAATDKMPASTAPAPASSIPKSTYFQPYTTTQKQMPTDVLVKQATPAVTAGKLQTDSSNSSNMVMQKNAAPKQLADDTNPTNKNNNVIASNNGQTLPKTPEQSTADNMNKLLSQKINDKTPATEAAKPNKGQVFSVYAGTHLSYAQGSNNQLNVGAGFASDFKISKRLKISAGLAIAQNTLSYNSTSTPGAAVNEKIFGSIAPASAFEQNFASSAVRTFGFAAPAPALPVLKKYNASLVGLDVPVSIKYEFNPDKGQTYVAAGFSSGTFINETYTSSYSSLQKTQQNTTKSSFSGFNIAKTLDFSVGWGYPLGKSNILIIEPFIKYPVNGAGTEQIRVGMSGLNLKLGFKH